jgi:hypothetical protein
MSLLLQYTQYLLHRDHLASAKFNLYKEGRSAHAVLLYFRTDRGQLWADTCMTSLSKRERERQAGISLGSSTAQSDEMNSSVAFSA